MKKLALLFILTFIISCKKNTTPETNNKVVWAETVQTILPLERDPLWNENDWNAVYKYDKKQIFSSITKAVLSGKLKAYDNYPETPFTVKEFNSFINSWDSTNQIEDIKNSGVFISAPLLRQIVPEEIAQLKFDEKIEFDTLSCSLIKKISCVTFYIWKRNEIGKIIGYKKSFEVKLDGLTDNEKQK